MAAAATVLAVVSFVDGRVVFGAIFAAMAITNVVLLATIWRRRARSASGTSQDSE